MTFSVSVLDIIIFLGIMQGIAAIIILRLRKNNIVSRTFCFLLFAFILINFKIQLHTLHIREMPAFYYFPLAIDLLIQPAFYIYFMAITMPNFKLKRSSYLHFLPCALFMVHAIVVYFSALTINNPADKRIIAEGLHYNAIKYFEDYLSIVSSFIYCFLCYKLLRVQLKEKDTQTSGKNMTKNVWLKSLVFLFFLLALLLMINIILENILKLGERTFIYWTIFYVYLSGFLYYLGITSIQHPEMTMAPVAFHSKKVNKNKSILIADQLKAIVEKEKLYKIPDLTLQELAKKMNISPGNLSFVINTHLKSNYRDFINDYKITAVKELLSGNQHENLSMFGIATEAGFSSEATFYRIFKNKVGMSPKEFKEKLGKKN